MTHNQRLYNHERQIANATALKPLVDAVVQGKYLQFLHNDNQWRTCYGSNMQEVAMSPHRYRVECDEQ